MVVLAQAAHDRPVTVVVDALDEAQHPPTLLSEVLAQLDPPDHTGRVQLIVGVRSPGGPDEPAPASDRGRQRPLADVAEHVLGATRLRVDEPPWWNPQDLADYATELLAATPELALRPDPTTTRTPGRWPRRSPGRQASRS